MANIIVSKTINEVTWSVDRTSFGRALKAVKSLKAAHERPAKALEKVQKRTAQSEGKAPLKQPALKHSASKWLKSFR